jgi:hypothetical protein
MSPPVTKEKYGSHGQVVPEIYMSDYHFYRDLDPNYYPGDDPVPEGILTAADVPGATR